MKTRVKSIFGWVLISVFFVAGAGALFWNHQQNQLRRASQAWPSVSGIVISSEKHSTAKSGGLWVTVRYAYNVSGIPYENNVIRFGPAGPHTSHQAMLVLNRYAEGTAVAVFYKPDAPHISCLEPGKMASHSQSEALTGVALLFVIFSFFQLTIRGAFTIGHFHSRKTARDSLNKAPLSK